MDIISHQLDNGLKVIFVDTKSFSTITTLLLVGAGSRYENEKNNGIAHFFEHMAFKGSKKYPNSFLISSTIEGIGAIFNAFTGKDHTGYWIKATNKHFDKTIDVLSDMVIHPLLSEEEIEREKGVIIEEYNLYEDTPYRKVSEIFEGLLYKGNALGYDIVGTKENVKSFKKSVFTEYINDLYQPDNAVLVVAGGIEGQQDKYLKLIKEKFDNWKKTKDPDGYQKIIEKQTQPQLLIKTKKTEQAHFCIGHRAFSFFDDRKYALNVLSVILGGGMSSRLFIQVRERRGLCYYISTGREHYADAGNIVTQAGIINDLKKIKEAIKVILKEQQKIVEGNFSEVELDRAKELIKGRFLINIEDSSQVANFYASKYILEKKTVQPEEVIKKVEQVTKAEVQSLAKQIFVPQNLNFALIGPFQKTDFTANDFLV